jgi:hypothetical protein
VARNASFIIPAVQAAVDRGDGRSMSPCMDQMQCFGSNDRRQGTADSLFTAPMYFFAVMLFLQACLLLLWRLSHNDGN